jgi:hypothetical protein
MRVVAAGVILLPRLDRPGRSPSDILVDGVHRPSEVMGLVVSIEPMMEKRIRHSRLIRPPIRKTLHKKPRMRDQVEVAQHFTRDAGPHGAAGGLTSRLRSDGVAAHMLPSNPLDMRDAHYRFQGLRNYLC